MSLKQRIANDLLLSASYVAVITRTASLRYKEYTIPKRSGGLRTIFHPSRELKAIQRWLLSNVITEWPVHEAAAAYRPHKGVEDNASVHKDHSFLLKLDFDTFFPSISEADLRAYLAAGRADALQWNDRDIWTFISLVCRNSQLTIGAPTSPAVSNALCFELDDRLATWASARHIAYTRYADDITFSCSTPDLLRDVPDVVAEALVALPTPRGLRLNRRKTRQLSKKHRRVVTGVVLTPTGELSIGRKMKRTIRSLIHSYDTLSADQQRSLAGLLSYAINIEPDLLNRLVIKFGSALVQRARTPPLQGLA